MAKLPGAKDGDALLVTAMSTVGALAAATMARRALKVSWRLVTGEDPPDNPQSQETDWMVAVMWAVASGAAVGVARMLVERQVVSRFAGTDKL